MKDQMKLITWWNKNVTAKQTFRFYACNAFHLAINIFITAAWKGLKKCGISYCSIERQWEIRILDVGSPNLKDNDQFNYFLVENNLIWFHHLVDYLLMLMSLLYFSSFFFFASELDENISWMKWNDRDRNFECISMPRFFFFTFRLINSQ